MFPHKNAVAQVLQYCNGSTDEIYLSIIVNDLSRRIAGISASASCVVCTVGRTIQGPSKVFHLKIQTQTPEPLSRERE